MVKSLTPATLILLGALLLCAAAVLSLATGPISISLGESLKSLLPDQQQGANSFALVIQQIRLPRTLLCICVGGILALCGTVMQGLFRNPLADPGIIGVSGGAALGAAVAIVLLAPLQTQYPELMQLVNLPLAAFIGGLITTLLVYRLGRSPWGTSIMLMLLAGIAISALSGAGIGLLSYLASDSMLRDLSLWQMGSLSRASWPQLGLCVTAFGVLWWMFQRDARALNALLLGDAEAAHLGIRVNALKRRLIFLSAIGVGITVSVAGIIGFIGLVIPHLGRMLSGPDHRSLLSISALLGALLLLLADMLARVIVSPAELPVGIITALLGAPFFLMLLCQQRGKTL
ncbi:FecCD family ABC transporter permease [Dongshaea marina]|uniref:FecCD family ABC transporter permease n=1 Tax=Dongshaea marina TaxID=2047966 RepID=UPI000D3E5DDB|nr:iron ABC transporter permease [Dongshaea marina]